MDEEEFDEECIHAPVAKFTKWTFWIHFFGLLMGLFNTFGVFFESLLVESIAASNKEGADTMFHEQAALEIETLVAGEPDA